jgi:hypothetical protein
MAVLFTPGSAQGRTVPYRTVPVLSAITGMVQIREDSANFTHERESVSCTVRVYTPWATGPLSSLSLPLSRGRDGILNSFIIDGGW